MVPKKEKHQQIDSKSKPFAIEKKYKGWTVGNCLSINFQRGGGEGEGSCEYYRALRDYCFIFNTLTFELFLRRSAKSSP